MKGRYSGIIVLYKRTVEHPALYSVSWCETLREAKAVVKEKKCRGNWDVRIFVEKRK